MNENLRRRLIALGVPPEEQRAEVLLKRMPRFIRDDMSKLSPEMIIEVFVYLKEKDALPLSSD